MLAQRKQRRGDLSQASGIAAEKSGSVVTD